MPIDYTEDATLRITQTENGLTRRTLSIHAETDVIRLMRTRTDALHRTDFLRVDRSDGTGSNVVATYTTADDDDGTLSAGFVITPDGVVLSSRRFHDAIGCRDFNGMAFV